MKKEGFPKQERIVRQKQIDGLFVSGQSKSLTAFPLRAVYVIKRQQTQGKKRSKAPKPYHSPVQILLSVSKKRFRHAVDRNRVKRQIREAYRLNKQLLSDSFPQGCQLALAFIWMTGEHIPSTRVTKSVTTILHKIGERLSSTHPSPFTPSPLTS